LKTPTSTTVETAPIVDPNAGAQDQIRQRAYELYEQSGRQEGLELEHWLQAENEILGTQAFSKAA
jgi:hypothetical protein